MKLLLMLLSFVALSASAWCSEPPRALEKANVLPLALDSHFQFLKSKTARIDPDLIKGKRNDSPDPTVDFQRESVYYGALSSEDRREREGHYFDFFWKTSIQADITVRLEYRQEKLGNHVQAREIFYPNAHGEKVTKFAILGDDYYEDGRITAWRALLIENGKIVGLTQSYLWN